MYDRVDDKEREQLREVIDTLREHVNLMGSDHDEIAMTLAKEIDYNHRTLQQGIVSVLAGALIHYGEMAATDARNESAVRVCRVIKGSLNGDGWLTHDGEVRLPLI